MNYRKKFYRVSTLGSKIVSRVSPKIILQKNTQSYTLPGYRVGFIQEIFTSYCFAESELAEITDPVCGHLTCEKYWERHDDEVCRQIVASITPLNQLKYHDSTSSFQGNPLVTVAYFIGTVLISFFLVVYYYLAYTHF